MNEATRNLAVGLTMIVALCLLGGMVVFFAGTGRPQTSTQKSSPRPLLVCAWPPPRSFGGP